MKVKDLFDLTGKKALVTGGSYGLGRAMAEALVEAGAEVGLVDISDQLADAARALASLGRKAIGIRADLCDRGERKRAFQDFLQAFGAVDILVNNAGITRRHVAEEFPVEDWDQVIEVNLTAVFDLCQMAGKVMLAQGSGKIINIASLYAFLGGLRVPAYTASKGGVAQLTRALANEWAGRGVHVNAIAPGYFDTPLNTALKNDARRYQEILNRIPAGRWGQPDDLKGAVVFLASRASDYVHGAILVVDGGFLGR
ncbi:MAG: 2-deoxy-D-gluconate 3-dehydrogenase [Deltaproteobacteria bacterium RBG_13_61_14]|nr:MAG: 2-deoxy-D-gluconate 3-dehydrogenase [Deltaproteobacteria bacterium RBG_13_61_14]